MGHFAAFVTAATGCPCVGVGVGSAVVERRSTAISVAFRWTVLSLAVNVGDGVAEGEGDGVAMFATVSRIGPGRCSRALM